jgi:hypothetical protein
MKGARLAFFGFAGACASALVLFSVACSSSSNVPQVPDGSSDASGDAVPDGNGLGEGGATITDAAPRTFGAACVDGGDCNSGVCFVGGMRSFCSQLCEAGTDCPIPPTLGQCNMRGYCKS